MIPYPTKSNLKLYNSEFVSFVRCLLCRLKIHVGDLRICTFSRNAQIILSLLVGTFFFQRSEEPGCVTSGLIEVVKSSIRVLPCIGIRVDCCEIDSWQVVVCNEIGAECAEVAAWIGVH